MNARATFTRMQDSTQSDWVGLIVPEPMLRRLMAKPKNSVYKAALKT